MMYLTQTYVYTTIVWCTNLFAVCLFLLLHFASSILSSFCLLFYRFSFLRPLLSAECRNEKAKLITLRRAASTFAIIFFEVVAAIRSVVVIEVSPIRSFVNYCGSMTCID
jgi:hypothetical protein